MATQIRFSEWSRVVDHGLAAETCREVDAAAEAWRMLNGLPVPPLSFAGPDGRQLCARQYVGVIEVDDVVIEIYPKLDSALIAASNEEPLSPTVRVDTVMHNLLWMLEVANHRDLVETTTAHLEEAPLSFFDLFAYLLGKTYCLNWSGVLHIPMCIRGRHQNRAGAYRAVRTSDEELESIRPRVLHLGRIHTQYRNKSSFQMRLPVPGRAGQLHGGGSSTLSIARHS